VSLKLISWNTAHRTRTLPEQVEALLERSPDIVALQEVTVSTRDLLAHGLAEGGLGHFACSLDSPPAAETRGGPRRYGVAIASRYPLECPTGLGLPVPWPEKTLSCRVSSPFGGVEVHTAHVPPGASNGWIKIETFEGIHAGLTGRPPAGHRLLCGDFNSPKEEHPDGTVVAWGQRRQPNGELVAKRSIRGRPGERWPRAERSVLLGLQAYDLTDVFRALHGYEREAASWVLKRKDKRFPRRFDHVFASASLGARSCEYLHGCREAGLSDHAMLEAVFAPRPLRA